MLDEKTKQFIYKEHQRRCYLEAILKLINLDGEIFIYYIKAKKTYKLKLKQVNEAYKRKIQALTVKYLQL